MNEVMQFRDAELAVSGEMIGIDEREFYALSNFSSFQVEYCDVVWPTSEHLYQATKFFFTDPLIAEQIRLAPSAHDAQKIAQANIRRRDENWEEMKVAVMYEICKLKLEQQEYVRKKLLQAGDLEIVEDSTKDDFWGWGPNRDGRNELGKIWMRLREELRAGEIQIQKRPNN